jgi:hypothetical protein
VLAPGLVIAASLAARRWGATVGGALAGLPVIAGPILLVIDLEHGDRFAAAAARGTLAALLSLSAFVAVWTALDRGWPARLLAGWSTVALSTLVLDHVQPPTAVTLVLVLAGFALVAATIGGGAGRPPAALPPRWDLPLRALITALLVLGVTTASGALGSRLSGLLAGLPILASVLAVFTHARLGAQQTASLLRGLLLGCVSFALFVFAVSVSLASLGLLASFALASAVALAAQLSVLMFITRLTAAQGWRR